MIPADLRVKQVPDCRSWAKTNGKFTSSDAMRSLLLYNWLQVLGTDESGDTVAGVVMKHGNGYW